MAGGGDLQRHCGCNRTEPLLPLHQAAHGALSALCHTELDLETCCKACTRPRLSTLILFVQSKEVKVENILVAKSQLSKLDFTLNITSLKLIRLLLKRVTISFKTARI